jgi:glycosyltransferase involved in cell wall biosynthesis
MNGKAKVRLAIVDSHPIQYHFQYYQMLGQDPQIDAHAFFCWDTHKGVNDPSYGVVKWDLPLLDGYQHSFLPNWARRPGPGFFGQINPSLMRILCKRRFDVVWVWGYANVSSWIAAMTAKAKGLRVLMRGEADLERPRSRVKKLVKELVVRMFLSMVDGVAYSCTANRKYYQHYGVNTAKLIFVPCAVDNSRFGIQAGQLNRSTARALLNLPTEAKVVLFVGQLIGRKRPLDLIKAVERLMAKFPVTLMLVGDGMLRGSLEDYCQSKQLTCVRFEGFKNQTQLAGYYAAADLFTLVSDSDPSPKTLNEAMNFHLPLVVTDTVGSAEDFVHNERNGFIVRCGDVDGIARAWERVLTNPAVAQEMGNYSAQIVSGWTIQSGYMAIREWLLKPQMVEQSK